MSNASTTSQTDGILVSLDALAAAATKERALTRDERACLEAVLAQYTDRIGETLATAYRAALAGDDARRALEATSLPWHTLDFAQQGRLVLTEYERAVCKARVARRDRNVALLRPAVEAEQATGWGPAHEEEASEESFAYREARALAADDARRALEAERTWCAREMLDHEEELAIEQRGVRVSCKLCGSPPTHTWHEVQHKPTCFLVRARKAFSP